MIKKIISWLVIVFTLLAIGLMVAYRKEISKLGEPKKDVTPVKVETAILEDELYKVMGPEYENPLLNGEVVEDHDLYLIALVTVAEAEGESELGKRLVIDTILNRVESSHFPDTIDGVVYQPHQFSSMWNGRVEKCIVTEDILQLVKEELVERVSYDVIFFMAGKYSQYGSPLFVVGNHYFSSLF